MPSFDCFFWQHFNLLHSPHETLIYSHNHFSLNCIKQNRWYSYLIHIKTMLAFLEVQPLSLDTFQCTPVYSYMSPCVEAYMSNIIWNSFDLRHECGKYYILLNFMFHGFGWINIFRQLHTKNLKQEFII